MLDFIATLDAKRAAKVLSDLEQFVPNSTPRDWVAMDFSWQLEGCDALLEFRWPTKSGGTPRVLWFYDRGQIVVCSHGVNKKGSLDNSELRRAETLREQYSRARDAGTLEIVALADFDPENSGG